LDKALIDTDIFSKVLKGIDSRVVPTIAAITLPYNPVPVTGNQTHYQRIQNLGYELQLDDWR
jgi:hypothetical protein